MTIQIVKECFLFFIFVLEHEFFTVSGLIIMMQMPLSYD